MSSQEPVSIQFTRNEALVLFDLSSRFRENASLEIEHPGEIAALWSLCGTLERVLVEPLAPDYDNLLAQARQELAEQAGTNAT